MTVGLKKEAQTNCLVSDQQSVNQPRAYVQLPTAKGHKMDSRSPERYRVVGDLSGQSQALLASLMILMLSCGTPLVKSISCQL